MKARKKMTPSRSARKKGAGSSGGKVAGSARRRDSIRAAAGKREKRGVAILGLDCTASNASELKSSLQELLEMPGPVTLDISCLQRLDTAAMQVLAAFVHERSGRRNGVIWRGTSQQLTTAARLLGLTLHL